MHKSKRDSKHKTDKKDKEKHHKKKKYNTKKHRTENDINGGGAMPALAMPGAATSSSDALGSHMAILNQAMATHVPDASTANSANGPLAQLLRGTLALLTQSSTGIANAEEPAQATPVLPVAEDDKKPVASARHGKRHAASEHSALAIASMPRTPMAKANGPPAKSPPSGHSSSAPTASLMQRATSKWIPVAPSSVPNIMRAVFGIRDGVTLSEDHDELAHSLVRHASRATLESVASLLGDDSVMMLPKLGLAKNIIKGACSGELLEAP